MTEPDRIIPSRLLGLEVTVVRGAIYYSQRRHPYATGLSASTSLCGDSGDLVVGGDCLARVWASDGAAGDLMAWPKTERFTGAIGFPPSSVDLAALAWTSTGDVSWLVVVSVTCAGGPLSVGEVSSGVGVPLSEGAPLGPVVWSGTIAMARAGPRSAASRDGASFIGEVFTGAGASASGVAANGSD